jgi:hypothetical protein
VSAVPGQWFSGLRSPLAAYHQIPYDDGHLVSLGNPNETNEIARVFG